MKQEFLKTFSLTDEQVAQIMAENNKDIKAEQDKATKQESSLKEQITQLTEQISTFDEQLKNSADLDAKAKAEIKKMQDEHAASVSAMQKKYEAENAKIVREAETKEFFGNLGKKFVTPEVRLHFEKEVNAALEDKANEGKNRADIYKNLIKDADGKERADIYLPEAPPTPPNPFQLQLPPAGKGLDKGNEPKSLVDALITKYKK